MNLKVIFYRSKLIFNKLM